MIEAYLDELSRELGKVGIRGRLRRRVLAESEDHLRSDVEALERFGAPADLANQFAAELGARSSRRAAVSAFAALGVAGVVYALSFVGAAFAGQPAPDTWSLLAQLMLPVVIVAPQVAFVAGSLGLMRTLRRRERVLPSAELAVINRRTGVALVSGFVTVAALAILASELRNVSADWWVALTLIGASIAAPLLVLAAHSGRASLPATAPGRRPGRRPVRRHRLRPHGAVAVCIGDRERPRGRRLSRCGGAGRPVRRRSQRRRGSAGLPEWVRTLRALSRPSSLASIGGECPSPKQRPISPT